MRTTIFCLLSLGFAALADPPIWFCPKDPVVRPNDGGGSPEYMDLFQPDAPWGRAAAHVKVFKVYPQWINGAADNDLKTQFADLNRRGMALALETGALTRTSVCGAGVEGFGGEILLKLARRIRQNGGNLRYFVMDEPVFFSTVYTGRNACQWTPAQMAADAARNIKALLAEFPDVTIGETEPVPAGIPDWISRYQAGIRAFRHALGFAPAFFDADVIWSNAKFADDLKAMRAMLAREGIPLGIIYDGDACDSSNASWIQSAKQHMEDVELTVGTPDRVLFMSWMAYPKKLLPEKESDSFTWLINQYFRRRTSLTTALSGQTLSGRLSSGGIALAGEQISVSASPTLGNGVLGTYSTQGVVPAGAQSIVFGARVNLECNCSGSADFWLSGFRYNPETGDPVARDFSNQLQGWGITLGGVKGAVAQVEGTRLHIAAQPGQTVMLNSRPVPVTGSGKYSFQVTAQVAPKSAGSGYFTVMFLGSSKASPRLPRVTIPLQAAKTPLATTTTDANGRFAVQLPKGPADPSAVEVKYAGSSDYWPARSAAITRIRPPVAAAK